jgi:biotin carboxylase
MARLLRRVGSVVDVAGMSHEQAAAAIAATGPDGILALADELLVWTAHVAELLELPFVRPATAERLTDKYMQRCALREAGVKVPRFRLLSPDHIEETTFADPERDVRFPAVIKPRNGEGSQDIIAVDTLAQLRQELATLARERPMNANKMLIEEYLPERIGVSSEFADYASVESIVSAGRVSHLALTGRLPPAEPFRETGFFIPGTFDASERALMFEAATEALTALGVNVGSLHTEIKMTPSGPRVIEINGRIGGGVPELLADATGIDLMQIALRLALGEHIVFERTPKPSRTAYLLYVHAPAWMRTVRSIDGLERLRSLPDVSEVIINRGPGQQVHWRFGNHGHVFSVRGSVAGHDELLRVTHVIEDEVVINGE